MKKTFAIIFMALACVTGAMAQSDLSTIDGKCGDLKWTFDGYTLQFEMIPNYNLLSVDIPDYDISKNLAPWTKKKLNVRAVRIGSGITRIGSCAFANCGNLQEVVFEGTDLNSIGWGAFLNCTRLKTISLPTQLTSIETIAFANCSQLPSVTIPDRCRVGNQAFISCTNLHLIDMGTTTILGSYVFASEVKVDGKIRHRLYDKEIRRLPSYVNEGNSREYGLSPASVGKITQQVTYKEDYDQATSDVDKDIPSSMLTRQSTYALVIGNQNYRFASNVPYAIHDARIFGEYCKSALGLPAQNIHVVEDATKQMILEEELEDWVSKITNREDKKLIVYYAGHGVPDVKQGNKAYILPTDVRGTNPKRGIALDDFYAKLNRLGFRQTTILLDACFSGTNRENEGVTEEMRDIEVEAEETTIDEGTMVVISAAKGNETAQGFAEEGHGLFTYYVLKELQKNNGEITLGELSYEVTKNVSTKTKDMRNKSGVKLRKPQTPTTTATKTLGEGWRQLNL